MIVHNIGTYSIHFRDIFLRNLISNITSIIKQSILQQFISIFFIFKNMTVKTEIFLRHLNIDDKRLYKYYCGRV